MDPSISVGELLGLKPLSFGGSRFARRTARGLHLLFTILGVVDGAAGGVYVDGRLDHGEPAASAPRPPRPRDVEHEDVCAVRSLGERLQMLLVGGEAY